MLDLPWVTVHPGGTVFRWPLGQAFLRSSNSTSNWHRSAVSDGRMAQCSTASSKLIPELTEPLCSICIQPYNTKASISILSRVPLHIREQSKIFLIRKYRISLLFSLIIVFLRYLNSKPLMFDKPEEQCLRQT